MFLSYYSLDILPRFEEYSRQREDFQSKRSPSNLFHPVIICLTIVGRWALIRPLLSTNYRNEYLIFFYEANTGTSISEMHKTSIGGRHEWKVCQSLLMVAPISELFATSIGESTELWYKLFRKNFKLLSVFYRVSILTITSTDASTFLAPCDILMMFCFSYVWKAFLMDSREQAS